MAKRILILLAIAAVLLPGCAAGDHTVTVEVYPVGVADVSGAGTYRHGEKVLLNS